MVEGGITDQGVGRGGGEAWRVSLSHQRRLLAHSWSVLDIFRRDQMRHVRTLSWSQTTNNN